jgi:hypothetical protein
LPSGKIKKRILSDTELCTVITCGDIYNFMLSSPEYGMEISGQLPALNLDEDHAVPTEREHAWDQELIWTQCRREKLLTHLGIESVHAFRIVENKPRLFQLKSIVCFENYIDCNRARVNLVEICSIPPNPGIAKVHSSFFFFFFSVL